MNFVKTRRNGVQEERRKRWEEREKERERDNVSCVIRRRRRDSSKRAGVPQTGRRLSGMSASQQLYVESWELGVPPIAQLALVCDVMAVRTPPLSVLLQLATNAFPRRPNYKNWTRCNFIYSAASQSHQSLNIFFTNCT